MSFAGILRWSLGNRALVLLLALALLAAGLASLARLPVDVLPELNRPVVTVHVEAPGLATADVETLATVPLEAALRGLPGLQRLRTTSAPGLALAYAEFGWDADPYRARQLVAERLDLARLPEGLKARLGPMTSLMGEILLLSLQWHDEHRSDPAGLRDAADWTLRPALLGVAGIAQVSVIGGEVRQYEVRPDPQRLRALGVSLSQIEQALRGHGRAAGGGYAEQQGQEIPVGSRAAAADLRDLAQVAVDWRRGAPLRLGQVAELGQGHAIRRGAAGHGARAAVILAVQKQPGADTVAVTAAVERRLQEIATRLPPGIEQATLFRQADFIGRSIDNLQASLLHASLIVALILLAFFAGARPSGIALTAIPLSMLAAILVFQALGLSVNTMTLGGLAIAVGELVDDAVVGVENVMRRLRGGTAPALETIVAATVEVRSGILYATLVIVLSFLPMLALQGIEGRLFLSLGIAYVAAILASLVVAVTLTPVLCSLLLRGAAPRLLEERRWLLRLRAAYARALARALRHSRGMFASALALTVIAVSGLLVLPRSFLPPFNEGTLTVNLVLQPGISLEESDRLGRLAETLIMQVPGVSGVGRRTGRAELDEHAEGLHYSELEVSLDDAGRGRDETIAALRRSLSVLPGDIAIGQPISHRLDHLLSGVRAPLVVKIFGDDLETLQRLAHEVQERLRQIDGLADVQVERQAAVPQARLRVDTRAAALYGLAPAAVLRQVTALTVGLPLSEFVDGDMRHELVLRLPERQRSLEALRELPLEAPGGPVPLSWIARLELEPGPYQVGREDSRRRIAVSAFATRGFERAGVEARKQLRELRLPPGYELRIEGQAEAQRGAARRVLLLAALSLLFMLVLLHGRYRSLRLSLMVLGNVPLACVGGVALLAITATPLSVASLVGFVTLAGIAVRNAILKISHYIHLARSEGESFGEALVLRGSAERLAPVLMTALIAALSLLPLVLSGDTAGREILHPVALVVFGGLLSNTLLDSFLTPALFLRYGEPPLLRLLKKS
ncbi:efflux RND transporter permease subunit [Solimonas sp. K1W22B-7]|uniref:efflux RND transporter permease subunit n=1 Tax=Solimonas sp. K1W22B-7 TaxID=2303331 RepID=UPI001969072C|nr:efflux RND transporter permease subunit [Solimonas sp. K1W22B-7]